MLDKIVFIKLIIKLTMKMSKIFFIKLIFKPIIKLQLSCYKNLITFFLNLIKIKINNTIYRIEPQRRASASIPR